MHVFTYWHLRETACSDHGRATVNQISACTYCCFITISGRLDEVEKDLLKGARIALNIGERSVADIEELCSLDNANLGIGKVGHDLVEELLAHREIGVDDRDEVSRTDCQSVRKV